MKKIHGMEQTTIILGEIAQNEIYLKTLSTLTNPLSHRGSIFYDEVR